MSRTSHSARQNRGGRGGQNNKKQISSEDQRFLENALAALPTGPAKQGTGFADDLQRFSYHANPYMRTFTKVLWSGFALSRGQVLECHTRFKQAHRDATMSNIDQVTVRALDEAASQLDAALAPDGSISLFLEVLREKTMQRIWARVCETSMLPPPSFRKIYGNGDEMSAAEMDAEEAAELAALLKNPEDLAEFTGQETAEEASGAPETAGEAGAETAGEAKDAAAESQGAGVAAEAANDEAGEAEASAEDAAEGGDEGAAPAAMSLTVTRSGGVDEIAELLMTAGAELLRDLRAKSATGDLKLTIRLEGKAQGGGKKRGRRRRRRR